MDLVTLYPSSDQVDFAKIVAEEIIASEVTYTGVDYNFVGVYLANIWSKKRLREGVYQLLPRKKSKRVRKPTRGL